MLSINIFKT